MSDVIVREFQRADADAFFELNRGCDPALLLARARRPGGAVASANRDPRLRWPSPDGRAQWRLCRGCCALIAIGPGEYELAKMAVTPAERRHGVGHRPMAAAIALGERIGATHLSLETNHTLSGAHRALRIDGLPATCRQNALCRRTIPVQTSLWSGWSDRRCLCLQFPGQAAPSYPARESRYRWRSFLRGVMEVHIQLDPYRHRFAIERCRRKTKLPNASQSAPVHLHCRVAMLG